jgi:hypothetical protein
MANEEIAAGRKKTHDAAHDRILAPLVKIDENVPAKNQIERTDKRITGAVEVYAVKLYERAELRRSLDLAGLLADSL